MVASTSLSTKNLALLNALRFVDITQRKAILRNADETLIKCICECALNTLNGNVPITEEKKKKLRKYATILRKLSENKGTWSKKKKFLIQKGGGAFLSILLSVVGSVLASAIGGGI